jgi:hypothetical protein
VILSMSSTAREGDSVTELLASPLVSTETSTCSHCEAGDSETFRLGKTKRGVRAILSLNSHLLHQCPQKPAQTCPRWEEVVL